MEERTRDRRWRAPSLPKDPSGLAWGALAVGAAAVAATWGVVYRLSEVMAAHQIQLVPVDVGLIVFGLTTSVLLVPAVRAVLTARRACAAAAAMDVVEARVLGASARTWCWYTFGYAAHCLELFGSRAWMVAFLGYSASVQSGPGFPWHAAAIAAVINLIAVPASIAGNEVALRLGRRRWIVAVMSASGTSGIVLALGAPWHWAAVLALLVVYSMLVMAESGTLTAGLVAAAPNDLRGAALGLYSLAGFGGGLAGPVLFGAALDLAGGAAKHAAWITAYAAIGAGCLAAPLVVRMNPNKTRL